MWFFIIVICIIILLIVILSFGHKNKDSMNINNCISSTDKKYKIDYNTKLAIDNIKNSKKEIQRVLIEANSEINTKWLKSYNNILKVSTNLDKNLYYQNNRFLEQSKFQYYTSLHFRSMMAANIVYKEYRVIDKNFSELNNFIVDIAKGTKKTQMDKSQISSAKDSLKSLRAVYLNKLHSMNKQTADLRDKIGVECGYKGKLWREKIMKDRV